MGKSYRSEEIVIKLRGIDLSINQGLDVVKSCRQVWISEQSYYRWRKEYGGMKMDQVKR